MIAEPSTSRRTFAAESIWPGNGRSAWISGRNATLEPWSASSESAHAMSAAAASRRARTQPSAPIALMNCVPLMSERPSFACGRIGSRPDARERLAAREQLALDGREALADERQREVRERREIARRADRPAARHEREHAAVQALEEQLDRAERDPRRPLGERVRAQEHGRADDLVRIRLPHAARVAAQEAELELLGLLRRDRLRDEAAEAGVDPVRVLAARARGHLVDEIARGLDSFAGDVGELRRRALDRNGPDVCGGEVVTGERNGHGVSLERPRAPVALSDAGPAEPR